MCWSAALPPHGVRRRQTAGTLGPVRLPDVWQFHLSCSHAPIVVRRDREAGTPLAFRVFVVRELLVFLAILVVVLIVRRLIRRR
jgi:hypothetical protein